MVRSSWSTRSAFLFAAIGSAVGLGNLWRFPYLTYEYGGGAFLIPYLIALFVLGIPLLILEFGLGQKMQKGAAHAFQELHGRMSGIGWAALIGAFMVVTYYAVVMAWSLFYLIKSFALEVPWKGNSKDYFFNDVLNISSGIETLGGISWALLFGLALVWCIIYLIVRNGTKSVGKVVMYTVPIPVILLVILLIRGLTLPGAADGIMNFLIPDFSALLNPMIWTAAASQIFFSLSLSFGIMIAYASYNRRNDIVADGVITSVTNTAISILAGFVVFAILGFMSYNTSTPIASMVEEGAGLAFVVFPEALAQIPYAPIFAIMFFATILTLGIDSAFSLVEAIVTSIRDINRKIKRKTIAMWVCLIGFLLGTIFVTGAGLYYLDIVDHFVANYVLLIVGIVQAIAIGWVYGAENMRKYINSVSKMQVGPWWDTAIKYIVPFVLTVLVTLQFLDDVAFNYGGYPQWAINIGWLAVIIPSLIIVIFSIIKPTFLKSKN